MIFDSRIWKEQLLKKARKLSKWQLQRRWSNRSLVLMEQEIMLGFFAIRKLIDSHKVSDEIVSDLVDVSRVPATGYGASQINAHKIDRLFDLESVTDSRERLRDLYNQVIHSFVFTFLMDEEGRADSFIVASDHKKDSYGMIVRLAVVELLFRRIGENHPASVRMERRASGELRVRVGPGDGTVPDRDVDALIRDIGL